MGAVLDARADRSQGPRADGVLAQRPEQRVPQRRDLPTPELPYVGEPGAVFWMCTRHRLERAPPAQHAGIESQLGGNAVAGRLEPLDPGVGRGVLGRPRRPPEARVGGACRRPRTRAWPEAGAAATSRPSGAPWRA